MTWAENFHTACANDDEIVVPNLAALRYAVLFLLSAKKAACQCLVSTAAQWDGWPSKCPANRKIKFQFSEFREQFLA